ncbi:integrin alpha-6b isoform X1 [Pygocentrus nattereri]|uniref:integrin alpha-6b isoform X1 n=2 Tax=Pygocentrus nattereri TaxID=42514 RepID=UPI001890F77D|nr:integrin alpha-6b isoform X1 [Pygocentrus nattereri]
MAFHWTLTLPLLCLMDFSLIWAFNLDTANVIMKRGDADSLFGFSLAMHRQLVPADKRMLLVGAPKAKKLSRQQSQTTGGLYTCDLNSPSIDCQRVDFDNDENLSEENKLNQWMGVTVRSQGPGGKIVTCAHRYQRRHFVNSPQESRDITGRCYVLSQDLKIDKTTMDEGGDWKFCQGRLRGHERFGSCQQGMSVTFTKDYHYLVFGAPGAFNWKGVVRVEQRNSTLLEMNIFDDGPYEVTYKTAEELDEVAVPANSYLGFSLDSGKMLTKKGQLTVVAGAPRANHSGAVVLLKKDAELPQLITEYILEGEGLASSFGYDLAVLDLNGDGWQDLVVGAPQYFEKNGDIGGAVYVYINQNGDWNKATRTRINGAKDSMFGLAVENPGDINLDGFNDVAIGAPHDENGAGSVYIYHGSASGLIDKPVQVLRGKDVNIKLFGYSLAGNMDLDGNQYPDLAIGSLSDTVAVFRARPVINIEKSVTMTPKELDLTKKNCGDSICLQVQACFKFTSNSKDYSPIVRMKYSIQVESKRKSLGLPSRVIFNPPSPTDSDYESTGVLELRKPNERQCITKNLKLQDNLKDKLRGIPIEVSVEMQNQGGRRKRQSSLGELPPVLGSSQPTASEVSFLKEGCGSDNVCDSNLMMEYKFCSREPGDIFKPLPIQNGVPLISLTGQKEIALEVKVRNKDGDDAYETVLTGSFPRSLSYSAIRSKDPSKPIICVANQNGSKADCELGNPFKRDSEVTFYIILGTGGISLDVTEVEVTLQLKTTSNQKALTITKKAEVQIELLLSLSGVAKPSQLEFTGEVRGESAMETESDVGSQIDYEFRIINLGKPLKSFGTASLNIEWPRNTVSDKWLLYLMKITTTGVERIGCSRPNEVNFLKLTEEKSPLRAKREVGGDKSSEEPKFSLFKDQRKFKVLSCDSGAKCVQFKCPLQGLDSNAVISLKARIWNGTFLEEFSDQNYVDIITKARLRLDSALKNIVLKNEDAQVRVTVFPGRKAAQYGGLPWWIILVAILLGLLLLGLLIFLLWKCGFFKRTKYDDSVPSYSAVRIKREERAYPPGKEQPLEKKQWMTSWNENESYS